LERNPVNSPTSLILISLLVGCATPRQDPGPSTDDTDEGTVQVTVSSSGPIECASPKDRDQSKFTVQTATENHLRAGEEMMLVGGALGVGDFTGDDTYEIFVPGDGVNQLWQLNQVNQLYEEVGEARFSLTLDLTATTGVSIADVDGDSDLDLFVTRFERSNVLLLNDGAGHFEDVTEAAGLLRDPTLSVTSAFGDMDADGDLDLFVGNYGPHPEKAYLDDSAEPFELGVPSFLYENRGDTTFVDISDKLPNEVQDAHVFMASWQDVNGDMWPELLTIHDFGWHRPSQLLWNSEGVLVADDGGAGFDIEFAGMGFGIGDVNDDLVPDFLQSSWKDISLLTSSNGSWWESATALDLGIVWEQLPRQHFGWGAELADVDLDGDLDAVVNYGHWSEYPNNSKRQGDALWLQSETGSFSENAAAGWGVEDFATNRGLVVADINQDGWPDLLKNALDGPVRIYSSNCGEGSWLKVRVRHDHGNTYGVGAQIVVRSGDQRWIRWIHGTGTSMFSAGPPEALFGLGAASTVSVEIAFPDQTTAVLEDVEVNQILTVSLEDEAHEL